MSHYSKVHPDRLIARSRRWSRGAIAATGAATIGLTGWIAAATATASTNKATTRTTTTSTQKVHHRHKATSSAASNTSSNSGNSGSSNYTPTNAPSISNAPVQGTTKAS